MSKQVRSKSKCCQSDPRCKSCPVVMRRLEVAGQAQRTGKRTYDVRKLSSKTLKTARTP